MLGGGGSVSKDDLLGLCELLRERASPGCGRRRYSSLLHHGLRSWMLISCHNCCTALALAVVISFREILPFHSAFANRLAIVAQYQVVFAMVGACILLSEMPLNGSLLGTTLLLAYIAFVPLTWTYAVSSVKRNETDNRDVFAGRFQVWKHDASAAHPSVSHISHASHSSSLAGRRTRRI